VPVAGLVRTHGVSLGDGWQAIRLTFPPWRRTRRESLSGPGHGEAGGSRHRNGQHAIDAAGDGCRPLFLPAGMTSSAAIPAPARPGRAGCGRRPPCRHRTLWDGRRGVRARAPRPGPPATSPGGTRVRTRPSRRRTRTAPPRARRRSPPAPGMSDIRKPAPRPPDQQDHSGRQKAPRVRPVRVRARYGTVQRVPAPTGRRFARACR
jgi:hypothetical protein